MATVFNDPISIKIQTGSRGGAGLGNYSSLMKPDTHLGENARQIEVPDDQATSFLIPLNLIKAIAISKLAARSGWSSLRCVAGLTSFSKSVPA
jgi:hypothetical protein